MLARFTSVDAGRRGRSQYWSAMLMCMSFVLLGDGVMSVVSGENLVVTVSSLRATLRRSIACPNELRSGKG